MAPPRRHGLPRTRSGHGAGGSGGLRAVYQCQHCGKVSKRWDYYVRHLREAHSVEHEPAPQYEPPSPAEPPGGDDDPMVQPVAPDRPVNHALSGPPSEPFWDWNKSSDGYKARTALPDVSALGLPPSVLDEYNEQMRFINTTCKPIVEQITQDTSYRPVALAQWEADKATFDECASWLVLIA